MGERAERVISAPMPAATPNAADDAAPSPPVCALPTEEERRQRSEHLKKQRDLLIQKRNAEREQQLQAYKQSQSGKTAAVDRALETIAGSSDNLTGAPLAQPMT